MTGWEAQDRQDTAAANGKNSIKIFSSCSHQECDYNKKLKEPKGAFNSCSMSEGKA